MHQPARSRCKLAVQLWPQTSKWQRTDHAVPDHCKLLEFSVCGILIVTGVGECASTDQRHDRRTTRAPQGSPARVLGARVHGVYAALHHGGLGLDSGTLSCRSLSRAFVGGEGHAQHPPAWSSRVRVVARSAPSRRSHSRLASLNEPS